MVLVPVAQIELFSGSTPCDSKKCKVAVRVGMQPGDNWRFCACTEENEPSLRSMTQDQADKVNRPGGVEESKLLTVWRKVHVEVDAMRADTTDTNMLTDTVDAATYDSGSGQTDLGVDDVPSDWETDDAFNGGWIKVQNEGTSPWQVADFDANLNDDDVFVTSNHESANAKTYWLGDDDYDNVGGNLNLKISHPRDPNTEWLESRLARAYVKPKLYAGTTDSNLIFDRNLGTVELLSYLLTDFDFAEQNSPAFWVDRLVSAHQPGSNRDNDPDDETTLNGATAGICAAVFLETNRDVFIEEQQDTGADERAVVVHEIGHTLGAQDITTGRDTAGVMYYDIPLPDTWYNGQSRDEIRDYQKSQN